MLHHLRRAIVAGIETLDWMLDAVPCRERDATGRGRWSRPGGWGCRIKLAAMSYRLEMRWHTGHWRPVGDDDLAE